MSFLCSKCVLHSGSEFYSDNLMLMFFLFFCISKGDYFYFASRGMSLLSYLILAMKQKKLVYQDFG